MKFTFKLFDFFGTPVNFRIWFLIFAFLLPFSMFVNLFIAVLLHEMGHAFIGQKLGYNVREIVIDFLAGSAAVENYENNHIDTLKIIVAGPAMNLLLLLLGIGLHIIFPVEFFKSMIVINVILLVFNLLPIYPMDGGRISKALICLGVKRFSKSRFPNAKGKVINGWLSLVTSVILLVTSLLIGLYVIALFSVLFIYTSYLEIKSN